MKFIILFSVFSVFRGCIRYLYRSLAHDNSYSGYVYREARERKIYRMHTVSTGEQDRHINLKTVVRGFYFHARMANKSRERFRMQESSRKARDFVDDSWARGGRGRGGEARFRGEVVPLIIICRSDRRDRIVHSINHDTAESGIKRSRRARIFYEIYSPR